jgi:hypothetical protein
MPLLHGEAFLYPFLVLHRAKHDLALVSLLIAEKASGNDIAL